MSSQDFGHVVSQQAHQEQISRFLEVSGCSGEVAREYLSMYNFNVEYALNRYLEDSERSNKKTTMNHHRSFPSMTNQSTEEEEEEYRFGSCHGTVLEEEYRFGSGYGSVPKHTRDEKYLSRSSNNEEDIPLEFLEGLISTESKKRDVLEKETRICVVGRVTCGKSSLINHLISQDGLSAYVCPSGSGTTTRAVSEHNYCDGRVDVEGLKRMLKIANRRQDGSITQLWTIKNPLWRNAVFIDTPGLNDYFSIVESDMLCDDITERRIKKTRHSIINSVKGSDLVLYLIAPNELNDESTFSRTLSMVVEWNANVIIVVTKFDELIDSELENPYQNPPKVNAKNVLGLMKKYTQKFSQYGCMVTFTQVKKRVGGNIFFTDHMIYDAVREVRFPPEGSILKLRNGLREMCTNRVWIPMKKYEEYTKKKNVKKKKKYAWLVGGGVAGTGLLAASVVGGISLIASGIVMATIIPGLGTASGAAAITSGLVVLGGSMTGGIFVTTTIGAGAALSGVVIGAVVGGGGALILSQPVSKFLCKLPLSSRMTMSLFHGQVGSVVGQIEIEKKNWKILMEYSKKAELKKKKQVKEYFPERRNKKYQDSIVVEYKNEYYVIVGVFVGPELKIIVDVKRIGCEKD